MLFFVTHNGVAYRSYIYVEKLSLHVLNDATPCRLHKNSQHLPS